MPTKSIYDVIVRPILTERSTVMKDEDNQYVFEVSTQANKAEIKKAIEALFSVHVKKVRTMIVGGKFRRLGRSGGQRPDWKKAIITLPAQEKIDLTEKTS